MFLNIFQLWGLKTHHAACKVSERGGSILPTPTPSEDLDGRRGKDVAKGSGVIKDPDLHM